MAKKSAAEKMAKSREKAVRRLVKNTVTNLVGTLEVHATAFQIVSVTFEYVTAAGRSHVSRADWRRRTPHDEPGQ